MNQRAVIDRALKHDATYVYAWSQFIDSRHANTNQYILAFEYHFLRPKNTVIFNVTTTENHPHNSQTLIHALVPTLQQYLDRESNFLSAIMPMTL